MRVAGRYNIAMRLSAFRVVESLWPRRAIDVRLTLSCLASIEIAFRISTFDCRAWPANFRVSSFRNSMIWDSYIVELA